MDVAAICSRKYRASRTSGKRSPQDVTLIVLHDEEYRNAEGAARWFSDPRPPNQGGPAGSAHLCVDDAECFRTLGNDDIPWGAHGANTHGFHIEQAGFARWSAVVWLSHYRTLQRAAYKTALHCHVFMIPPVFRWAPQLRLGYSGVTTHAECTKAFGGTHTDPGLFWPRRVFMRLVRRYYAELSA